VFLDTSYLLYTYTTKVKTFIWRYNEFIGVVFWGYGIWGA